MALALYRKYRPRTFAEVIGQEHVTEPLSQALRSGRINHAYLFSGPRGCGKTSSARILARSLNCEQGPTPEPCGVCGSCKSLANDGAGSIDVIEIDAASHGGVDDARELREKAFFAPANSRYKIYVIDEAHMVSSAGFNALLKLVEEPPDYVRFIFATTEPDKVLGTIRSRTHHYPFRLIPPAVLRPYLQQLTEAEGVTVEPAVYPLVVRAGGGSARDTLSILDQLIAGSGSDGVTYSSAVGLLGVTDVALIDEMCDALAEGNGAAAYATIDRVAEAGHEPRRFASDLLERFRDLIILQQVPDAVAKGLIDGPADQLETMAVQASRLGAATLSRSADILHNGLVEMRGTTAPRLLLELVTARMLLPGADTSTSALLQRLERLERGVTLSPSAPPTSDVRGEHPAAGPATDVPSGPAAGSGGGGAGAAKAAAMAAARAAAAGRPTGAGAARPVSPAAPLSPPAAAPVSPAPSSAAPVSPATSSAALGSPAAVPAVPVSPAALSPSSEAAPASGSPASGSPSGVAVATPGAGGGVADEPDWNRVAAGNEPVEAEYYDDEPPPWDEDPPEAAGPPEPPRRAPARPDESRGRDAAGVDGPGTARSEPVRSESARPEPARPEPVGSEPVGSGAGHSEGVRSGSGDVPPDFVGDESAFDQAEPEPVRLDARLEQIRDAWQALGRHQPKVKAMQDYGIGVREVDGNTVVFVAPNQVGMDRFLTWADAIAGEFRKAPGGVWRIRCEVGSPDAAPPRGGGRPGATTDRRDQSADRRMPSGASNRTAPSSAAPERNTGRTESRPSRPPRAPAADADEDGPAPDLPASGSARSARSTGQDGADRLATGSTRFDQHADVVRPATGSTRSDQHADVVRPATGSTRSDQHADVVRPATGSARSDQRAGAARQVTASDDAGWPEPVAPGARSAPARARETGRPGPVEPDGRAVPGGRPDSGDEDWPEPVSPGSLTVAGQQPDGDADWPEPARPGGIEIAGQGITAGRPAPETEYATDPASDWPEAARPGGAAGGSGARGAGSDWPEAARPGGAAGGSGARGAGSDWPEAPRPGGAAGGSGARGAGSDWPEPARPGGAVVGAGTSDAGSDWPEPVRPGGGAAGAETSDAGSEWPEPVRPGASASAAVMSVPQADSLRAAADPASVVTGSGGVEALTGASGADSGSGPRSGAGAGAGSGLGDGPGAAAGQGSGGSPGAGVGSGAGGGPQAAAASRAAVGSGAAAASGTAGTAGGGAAFGGGSGAGGGSGTAAGLGGGSAFGGAAVAAVPRDSGPPAASARSAAMEAARAAARTGMGGAASGGGAAAARAALAGARNVPGGSAGARPGGSTWADGSPIEEAPYDPEYDGPAPAAASAYEGFDPGDEPLDVVIDEKTARQSSEEQAIQLLREAFGAEKIAEL